MMSPLFPEWSVGEDPPPLVLAPGLGRKGKVMLEYSHSSVVGVYVL